MKKGDFSNWACDCIKYIHSYNKQLVNKIISNALLLLIS